MQIRKINRVLILLAVVLACVSYAGKPSNFFLGSLHTFSFLVVVPAIALLALGKRLSDFGLQLGDWRTGLKYSTALLLISLPFMIYGASLADFGRYYPLWKGALGGWQEFILFELFVGLIMFSTEFFYRGFLLFNLKDKWWGNLFHSFLYMLVHLGKPGVEVPYSFFAGYVFGWVDLKTDSILPSFLMHFISSIIFDLLIIML
ncbi:type II CAAX prenyl endopeptidase Rce1 family protein [Candidatus Undinarchaeota archaeon]